MNAHAERKRLLVLEAELHRSIIALERDSLRGRLAPLTGWRRQTGLSGPWLIGSSALAGVLAVWQWRKLARWLVLSLVWRRLRAIAKGALLR